MKGRYSWKYEKRIRSMCDMIEEGFLFFLVDEVISVDSGCFLHEFKNIWWKSLDDTPTPFLVEINDHDAILRPFNTQISKSEGFRDDGAIVIPERDFLFKTNLACGNILKHKNDEI